MSTVQARNILNNQIDRLIDKAKEEIKNEGRKKIEELKSKIPTPQELAKKLLTDINADTCSPKGNEKFMKIYNSIIGKIDPLEKVINSAIEKVEGIENEIKPIVEESGPVGKLKSLMEIINPIIQTLNIIILAAPALFAANSGPTATGTAQDQITDKRNKAYSKVKEYSMLISMISQLITFYANEAQKVFIPINLLKRKLKFIKEEIIKIKAYLFALLLKYQGGCTEFLDNQNTSNPNPPIGPQPPDGPTPLETYLAQVQEQYNDVYQQLLASGNTQATEIISAINEDTFEKLYNISFKTKDIT